MDCRLFTSILLFAFTLFNAAHGRYASDSAGKPITTCPQNCELVGEDAGNWTHHRDVRSALQCRDRPVVLSYDVATTLEPYPGRWPLRSCYTFKGDLLLDNIHENDSEGLSHDGQTFGRDSSKAASSGGRQRQTDYPTSDSFDPVISWDSPNPMAVAGQMIGALAAVQSTLRQNSSRADGTAIITVQYGDTIAGLYAGSGVPISSADELLSELRERLQDGSLLALTALQAQSCNERLPSERILGLISYSSSIEQNLPNVHRSLNGWRSGLCQPTLDSFVLSPAVNDSAKSVSSIPVGTRNVRSVSQQSKVTQGHQNWTAHHLNDDSRIRTILRGQKPSPNPDGSCAAYFVQSGDACVDLADQHGITVEEIEKYNVNTWQWSNCGMMWAGINICLSEGSPPMPAPVPDTQCGPIVPGTKRPSDGTNLADLNPCPLRACCDVWGYCGTTDEFCTVAPNGGPGTTQPGVASCISNCGTKLMNVDKPPKSFSKIAYYEAWNYDRSCLHMDPRQIDDSYTHVHYAFANIDETLTISVGDTNRRFQRFRELRGKKKIITLGGWAQSTEPATYSRLRNAVLPANRDRFADNVAYFVRHFGLDGVDIDWEYPGETDMPDIPPGSPDDGMNYLALLKAIRSKLPDKSISIAAPASFWYLKAFPIEQIASVVDYIVYMTYDLNGQWSYGNKWALTSCEKGNCLRSHVNFTETMDDLTMITKAGVPSNKIMVGIPSYGRSFKMETPGCSDPTCFFTGPKSGATPGRCTNTAGILAKAEIDEIIRNDPSARTKEIQDVSNILTYGGDQWVSYVDNENVQRRIEYFRGLNFAGVADWAVDQASFLPEMTNLPTAAINQGTDSDDEDIENIEASWRLDLHRKSAATKHIEAGLQRTDMPWMQIKCTDPYAQNETGAEDPDRPGVQRMKWQKLRADEAWNYMMSRWVSLNKTDGHSAFMREMSDQVHVRRLDCNITNSGGCQDFVECVDHIGTGPAAMLIMNSLIAINKELLTLYNGFKNAHASVAEELKSWTKTFAPMPKTDKLLDVFVGIGQFALQLIAAPAFNKWLKDLKYFSKDNPTKGRPEQLGIIKDDTGALITLAGNMIKGTEGKNPLRQEIILDTLTTVVPKLVDNWQKAIYRSHDYLFGHHVTEDATHLLYNLINNGSMLLAESSNEMEVTEHIKNVIYASLLPPTWRAQNLRPILVEAGPDCDKPGVKVGTAMGTEAALSAKACVDKKLYYLVSPEEGEVRESCAVNGGSTNGRGKTTSCPKRRVRLLPLPGSDDIASFGTLTRDDLATSAVRGYQLWGNNAPKPDGPDFANQTYYNAALPSLDVGAMLTFPGVFTVPVCSYDDIVHKPWKGPKDRVDYPCPP